MVETLMIPLLVVTVPEMNAGIRFQFITLIPTNPINLLVGRRIQGFR